MDESFLKPYDPKSEESKVYTLWEKSGYFNPDNLPGNRPEKYCIVMPPPNANGRLHSGHGADITLKDILIRFNRMRGKKTLLLPGSDHAGFETQGVYEKKLQKEGRSRFGMNRDDLYKEIYDFVMDNKHIMEDDVKKLGTSCDWSRNTFTLEPEIVSKVQDTFRKMYEDGLIYRGKRSIHWNPKYQTSLSDIETDFEERKDPFYYFKYGPFTIGTARPETKFGDKYVVVHPDDKRYKDYDNGQKFEIEWINGPLTATLIKDEAADPEMGSGAMTITPWHSAVDFEIAKRHNLDMEQIIDWQGKLLPIAEEFTGMRIAEARPKIVEKLEKKGLLVKIDEEYTHAVRICERTGVVVEPQVKDQWFVKMEPLTKMALESLDRGEYRFLTEHHEKIFRHWMNRPLDWNISRQIVWGIRIPAWFRNKDSEQEEIIVSKQKPGDDWEQDPDTFDTWFSSGQWPLMTLGYPDGKDMEYYPTDVMETGSDLVFKWVPRMIMFGLYLNKKVPFRDVYFHGMILDEKGKKMSKSKGNVLSPIDLADEFGTDATRMSFVVANPPGANMSLSKDKVRAYKKFANKIWNISRFILENVGSETPDGNTNLTDSDKKLLEKLDEETKFVTEHIEKYRMDLAAERLYHYVWHEVADIILEDSKEILNGPDGVEKKSKQRTLYVILATSLKLLHPFMPFVTESIWQKMGNEKMLMVEEWPQHTN
ncbi:MAG: valine--tRNA ligase [Parcubacteria group bacterium CG11_big_fil_rev_8_21_14_0_20_39_22]|nr:MAG: valine--tRNA ligase [Parcubacteria group bacterium CG11_big_fil_rev_8_21_14_0_20_39_22]